MRLFMAFMVLLCNPVVCCSCVCSDQSLCCGGSCLYVTVLCFLWMWQGFPRVLVMLTNTSSPTVVRWHNTLLFAVCFPIPQCSYWKKSKKYITTYVCVCVAVCYVWACSYMQLPAQTSGWSVLIILKLLHNAIKHYNYHKLNIQNTHWRICGLGILFSRGVLEMMGLGDVWRETGRGMISREMVNHLGKETQGKNKARRKCTCQTEQQLHKLCHSSVVRRLTGEEREEREKLCRGGTLLLIPTTHCGSSIL